MKKKTIISFVADLPNLISLIGLFFSVMGIFFVVTNLYRLSMICILWAIFFDWTDGIVARKIKDRSDEKKVFGKQLDSMIDIISFGVFPALFILSYGNYSIIYLPLAFLIIATAAIRLSYFNMYGLADSDHYVGLALDNNLLILAFIFLFEIILSELATKIILSIIAFLLMILNLSHIRTKKLSGIWYYILIGFNLILTAIYFLMYLFKNNLV